MTISQRSGQPDDVGRPTVLGKFHPAPRVALPADESATDSDAPLLGDGAGLRASWQQVQGTFVDDPRAAVTDAADLTEHAAQALIGALRQRQRQLRASWDRDSGPSAAGTAPDTEQLRLTMQRYRALFNQICRP